MRHFGFWRLFPGVVLALCLLRIQAATMLAAPAGDTATLTSAKTTNAIAIKPGPGDGIVAYVAAELLEKIHFSRQAFDDSVSASFLDRYLESLDPQHLHFLESDLAEFAPYQTNLDNLTAARDGMADVTPAFQIFSRFYERLRQHVAYVEDLLQHETFNFDADERVQLNRRELAYPRDLAEAKQLWRQRLRYDYLQEKLALEDPDHRKEASAKLTGGKTVHDYIVDLLRHRYQRNVRLFTDWNNEDVLGVYLTALANVYDPHSDYFNREQFENFEIPMNLQLFGIGAELRSEDGNCKISRLLPGPAAKSKKVKEGDMIVAVAQSNQPPVDIVDMSLNKVVQLIRGPKGTEVRLTIAPTADPTDRKIVSLVRDEIALEDQAAKGKIIEFPKTDEDDRPPRVGIIDLPSFYAPMPGPARDDDGAETDGPTGPHTSADVARLLEKFKREKVDGVILDLRRNGGGSLEEAIKLTGLFIKSGPVVQVVRSDGRVFVQRDLDSGTAYDGPLVVLTSRMSASASEIVAGALQDYGRAIVVGDSSTFGKGTVQNLNPLRTFIRSGALRSDPGALKITVSKFYRASGASTQKKGVMPDIVLPSVRNVWKDFGEGSLENPLEWDIIRSARYEKLNQVQPFLSELLQRSQQRIATNRDFAYIREDIEQYRKMEAEKTVSLNEKERLKEKKEADARTDKRKKELLARPEPVEKIYEITLKTVDLPGLPPPVQRTNSLAANSPSGSIADTNVTLAGIGMPDNPHDAADDPKIPLVDADLEEAEHILLDYITLLEESNSSLVTRAAADQSR